MKRNQILIFGASLLAGVSAAMTALAADLRGKNPGHEIGLRSASHFRLEEYEDAEVVHVIGDFPDIVEAYEANEVKVVKHKAPTEKAEKAAAKEEIPPAKLEADLTHMPTKESQLAFLATHKVKVPAKASDEKIVELVAQTQAEIAEKAKG